jgi:hypothetical protein
MVGANRDAVSERRDAAVIASSVLESLTKLGDPLRRRLSKPVQWPESDLKLDVDSRRPDRVRMVKHVHQSCALHTGGYRLGTEMKLVHLVDAFDQLARAGNGLGLYPVARSCLELFAQVLDVASTLRECQQKVRIESWLPPAEEFFKAIVRARFATSNESHAEILRGQGASSKVLKPMHVMESIRLLSGHADAREAGERYGQLCDAVHHNLSSTATVTSGSGVVDAARHPSGGMIVGREAATVTEYQYPVVWKADIALASIGSDFVEDVRQTLHALAVFPESPLSPEFLQETTGSPLGVVPLQRRSDGSPILPPTRVAKQGRNETCACGSGRKVKHCCGK